MNNSKSKGSAFEREIAATLSKWWSKGERDDIFYRSSSSGARATGRAKLNKATANSAGDLCYLDADGKPFIDYFAVEIKRGYPDFEIQRILDREDGTKLSLLEQWIQQAAKSQEDANAWSWMIIAKKNRSKTLVILPYVEFCMMYDWTNIEPDEANIHIEIGNILDVAYMAENPIEESTSVICFLLDEFLEKTKPDAIRTLVETVQKPKATNSHIYKLKVRQTA